MKACFTFTLFMPLYIIALGYLIPSALSAKGPESTTEWISIGLLFILLLISCAMLVIPILVQPTRSDFSGGEVQAIEASNADPFSFYGAVLIPLVSICQLSQLGGTICFGMSLLLATLLIYKTKDYLANLALALLGFKVL